MDKFDFFSFALTAFGLWLAINFKNSADKVNADTTTKLVSIENNTKSQLTAVQTDINNKLTVVQTDVNTKLGDTRSDISTKLVEIKAESLVISRDIMSELKRYNEAFRKGEITNSNNKASGENFFRSEVSDVDVDDNKAK